MGDSLFCISGPSSTGKSTLLAELEKRLPDVVFVKEWARHLFETKYSQRYGNLDELLNEKAYEFQMELANLTIGNRIPNKTVIVDRAPLDIFIYSMLLGGKIGAEGLIKIMQTVAQSSRDVDAVFMTSDLGYYEDDGFRSDMYRQIRQAEVYMFKTYPTAMVKQVIWLPDTLEGRVKTVLDHLEKVGALSTQIALI